MTAQAAPSTSDFTYGNPNIPAEEAVLWRRFREQKDEAAREALICLHVPFARIMAATLYSRRYHDEIEFSDYLQMASIGLVESIDRFDPGQAAQFRTFAKLRIQGAILDGIERETEKQQQIAATKRMRAQRVDAAKAMALFPATGESPDKLLAYLAHVGVGIALQWLLEDTNMVASDQERSESLPFYQGAEIRQFRERVAAIMDALPGRQPQVLRYIYFQGMTFEEAAVAAGLTKGRISQIHKLAMETLRERLHSREQFEADW